LQKETLVFKNITKDNRVASSTLVANL